VERGNKECQAGNLQRLLFQTHLRVATHQKYGERFAVVDDRLHLKCNGTCAETRFRLSTKRTSPFKSAWGGGVSSVDCWQASCAHISLQVLYCSCEPVFCSHVTLTGYPPLHSLVSPSLLHPVRHRVPSHFKRSLQHNKSNFSYSVIGTATTLRVRRSGARIPAWARHCQLFHQCSTPTYHYLYDAVPPTLKSITGYAVLSASYSVCIGDPFRG
jgi:hypothetical protein